MPHEALLSRASGRFTRQLLDLVGPGWMVASAGERPWASATYQGLRVTVRLVGGGTSVSRIVCQLCATIEQADYGVRRYLVADISAAVRDQDLAVEALLIERA